MKGLTILLGVLCTVMLVIYAAGDPISKEYFSQSVYMGNNVYVEDAQSAEVNGESVRVAHEGFSDTSSYAVDGIIEISTVSEQHSGNATINVTRTQTYLILSHEVGGAFGKSTPLLAQENPVSIVVGEDFVALGEKVDYIGDFTQDGVLRHIYEVDGLYVVVGLDKYAFVRLNDTDGSGMLLRQEADQVTASEVQQPFDVTNVDLAKMLGILLIGILAGYWLIFNKKGARIYGRET